jgi:hypothetical protein
MHAHGDPAFISSVCLAAVSFSCLSSVKKENLSLANFARCDDNADAWYGGVTRGYEGGAGDCIVVGGMMHKRKTHTHDAQTALLC